MSKEVIAELQRLRSILSGTSGLEDDDQEYIEDARKSVDQLIKQLAEQPARPDRVRELECVIADLKAECQALRAEHPTQQEPVAVTYKEVWEAMNALYAGDLKQVQIAIEMGCRKLYTAPQPAQRTWAWLTDGEKSEMVFELFSDGKAASKAMYLLNVHEAKLKEKNT